MSTNNMAKMGFLFDLVSKDKLFQKLFNDADQKNTGELDGEQLQAVHASIRPGGISIRQTEASISEICAAETCDIYEFFDVLNEMDRRYFLVKDLQWEFAMLDGKQCGTIREKDARFLFQAVYDEFFSHRRWLDFLKGRRVRGSGISFAEIEVELCNIPSAEWLEQDAKEEERERGGTHPYPPRIEPYLHGQLGVGPLPPPPPLYCPFAHKHL
jgi:Ca2+-binding EF-hand superfamily protein